MAKEGGRGLRVEAAVKVGVGANQRAKVSFGTAHTWLALRSLFVAETPDRVIVTCCQVESAFP